jgi:hemolysin activation/secretion protein
MIFTLAGGVESFGQQLAVQSDPTSAMRPLGEPPLPQRSEAATPAGVTLPEDLQLIPQSPAEKSSLLPILPPSLGPTFPMLFLPPLYPEPPYKFRLSPIPVEPVLPPLPPLPGSPDQLGSQVKILVRGFRFTGNKVIPTRELAKLVARYTNRQITGEELEDARRAITLHYISKGYVNSGAVLEDQDIKDGFIVFHILEGKLTDITISGNWWFRTYYLRGLLRRSAGRPLNFNSLKDGLELLRQNPNVERVNAEIKPGNKPDESQLEVSLKERQPFRLALEAANDRPPTVGANELSAVADDLNVTGHNDVLHVHYGILNGDYDHFEWSGLKNVDGFYRFPILPWGTTAEIHGMTSDATITEAPFADLNIKSKTTGYGVTFRHSVVLRPARELAVGVTVDRRHNETSLLDQPFSLSPGAVDGEEDVFVVRIFQEYAERSDRHVLSLRSCFNIGLSEMGATVNATGPDTRFFSWVGQAQYVRRLWSSDAVVFLRVNGQASNKPLLALEQFSLGGINSVRGYRENALVRDTGLFASVELRKPFLYDKKKNGLLFGAVFFDVGGGWNVGGETPDPKVISSAGAGLIFTTQNVTAQLYWGYAFNRELVSEFHDLQDYGIHFRLSIQAF